MSVPKSRRKQSRFEAQHHFYKLRPKAVVRERRRLRAYKRMVDSGRIPYDDVEQAVKSWMGEYSRIMSKKQICHIKQLYAELFGKELSWKK